MSEVRSINPFTEDVVWTHALLSPNETEEKIALSQEVQKAWALLDESDRLECLKSLARVFEEKTDEFAKVMTLEMGKTFKSAQAEIKKCAFTVNYLAENFPVWNKEVAVTSMSSGKHRVVFRPLGVTLGIMPWNFPVWQAVRFLAPSLALGNSVLLKPASNVFQSSKMLEEALLEAGFPEGVYQHLSLDSSGISQVVTSEKVAGVSLTGSAPAGKRVAEEAGKNMKKMVFELGGSDPYLILEDADLKLAAAKCAESRLLNSGQSCICAKRFIVDEKVKEEFLDLFTREMAGKKYGDPFEEGTDFGPLARKDLRKDLHKQVERAEKSGGRILTGGEIPSDKGYFYPPTVIADVDVSKPVYQEEFFGPVALVNSFKTLNEAFEIANTTPFGLGSGIFSKDAEKAGDLAARHLHAGMSVVNDYLKSDVRLPFGGVKDSGFGRELSPFGIHEFANIKSVSIG
jgi:succinate-semialdehyde dehydrogenase/glutarate-semialdehyde dehydrogenase